MLAQVLHTPAPAADGPLRAEERPVPLPGPGQVRVAVAACGVCRTDLQLCEGDLPARRLPIVPGHQVVGHIDAVGAGVTLSIGDAVGIAWIAGACGVCRFCTTQRENLCVAARFTGWDVDGGYAEAVVADAAFVHRLPDGADPVAVAPLLCGGAIGYRALRVAGVGPDRPGRVGLLGFGASATCAIQVARHWGWEVHVLTRSVAEQDRARALGAAWAGAYDDDPPDLLDAAVQVAGQRRIQFGSMPQHAAHQVLEVFEVGDLVGLLVGELGDQRALVGMVDLPGVDRLQRAPARARTSHGIDAVGTTMMLVHACSCSLRRRSAISIATSAASSPLLPWLPPARASASSNFSTASTPFMTGTPVSSATRISPSEVPSATCS